MTLPLGKVKRCPMCERWLDPHVDFYPLHGVPDGRQSRCKECQRRTTYVWRGLARAGREGRNARRQKGGNTTARIHVEMRTDPKLKERAKAEAKRQGVSLSRYVAEALDAWTTMHEHFRQAEQQQRANGR